ncbi:DNA topoisomerase III [Bacillus mangrovi]|uniref:DNA topoisomerase n=1 Tax=Metabacillus mangrovi TaxID=1491830 RepID=A0A7X2V6L9_9BACI|nr:type IA DNA topoisomerase [Metabacillus mangrovi]MTH55319.1 DNA topoisomerase III [Metabacillus mangrovi]
MIVILAEKPDQGKLLSAPFPSVKKEGHIEIKACGQFPEGAVITWAIGHLVELKNPHEYDYSWKKWSLDKLPIIPERFEYKVSKGKAQQYRIVRKLLNEASEIIIGTDAAREGENIARLLIRMAGASRKPIRRLWLSSYTDQAVRKGFASLKDGRVSEPLFYEAQARQIGDWLVGMNASRLYTLLLQQKGIRENFSVGRVQTPVLKLIYDRQKEIEQFKPEPFVELEGEFTVKNGTYKGKHPKKYKTEEELQKAVSPDITPGKNRYDAAVKEVAVQEKRLKPPMLHSLSTLQANLNRRMKMNPTAVLKIVQKLYEKGFVSYPRTDSQHITEEEFSYLKGNLAGYQKTFSLDFTPKSLFPSKRFVDSSKVKDHYAIVPTEKLVTPAKFASFSPQEKTVYDEIAKSVLKMFMDDHVYDETVITTAIGKVDFLTKGKTVKTAGWKSLENSRSEKEEGENPLPAVSQQEHAAAVLAVKEGMTQPPKPYTPGQLITLMKTAGKHIEDKEMKEALNAAEGLGTEATRAGIIDTLTLREFIEISKNSVFVTPKGCILCEAVEGTLLSKPEMTAKWETFLKEIGSGNKSKDVFIENAGKLCMALMDQAKADVGKLEVNGKFEPQVHEGAICKCPVCKEGNILDRRTYYGCSGYMEGCKQSFSKKILNKSISPAQIKLLCEKGKTRKIKGFKGKKNPFDAYLVLNGGKIEFSFK